MVQAKVVTARVPARLQQAVTNIARERGESVNAFVTRALEREVREREEQAFYDSFTLLGSDLEAANIEFAFDAQAEVAHAEPATR